MSFVAKSAAPIITQSEPRHPAIEEALAGTTVLFSAPAGYLLTESLAASLTRQARSHIWLRLGPEDNDPATFLISLIAAVQLRYPRFGASVLEQMVRHPGPTAGWHALFTQIAQDLTASLHLATALVLELDSHFINSEQLLSLIYSELLSANSNTFTCILINYSQPPRDELAQHLTLCGSNDLRLDAYVTWQFMEQSGIDLSQTYKQRLVTLSEGRAEVCKGLCEAVATIGAAPVIEAIARAKNLNDLLSRIAHAWLHNAEIRTLQALGLAMDLEYIHANLIQVALGDAPQPHGPWLQFLENGWMRVRLVWKAPLRAILKTIAPLDSDAISRAADYLAQNGAIERAVSIYFSIGHIDKATHVITEAADSLMAFGQWETLNNWIQQLPDSSLRAAPWLVYTQGEIAAAQGDTKHASQAFVQTTSLFLAENDPIGACQSMLAESAIAIWNNDIALAEERALSACHLAIISDLVWYECWARWHLGCLAAASSKFEEALSHFNQAVTSIHLIADPVMTELVRMAQALVLEQWDLSRQREFHRQAYFALEQAEQKIGERMKELLSTPSPGVRALLNAHGWLQTPLILKMTAPPVLPAKLPRHVSFWNTLLSTVGLRRQPKTLPAPSKPLPMPPTEPAQESPVANRARNVSLLARNASSELLLDSDMAHETPLPTQSPITLDVAENIVAFEQHEYEMTTQLVEAPPKLSLTVHLLGPFRVMINEQQIDEWASGRGRAVFKYLLAHHTRPLSRDVLMDIFWPNASPKAARNSLNVALYGLRQTLKSVTDSTVILFHDMSYQINPDFELWLDVDEFEQHLEAGRRYDAAEQIDDAIAEYEVVTELYQGDFLVDDPYEEWSVLPRERLRVAYLDTLDRLSSIYFSRNKYASCVTLCQHILEQDNCREDSHCRLMRCYSRQNQQYLALRQYQLCVEALRDNLGVDPAPATTQLYERIRRRDSV